MKSKPSILLNDRIFPSSYRVEDIKNFIEPVFKQNSDKIKEQDQNFTYEET
ncbi:MAG: hypothetical protein AAGF85_04170 [Bacteroidota bacterium]